jgi:hypothetical protein
MSPVFVTGFDFPKGWLFGAQSFGAVPPLIVFRRLRFTAYK